MGSSAPLVKRILLTGARSPCALELARHLKSAGHQVFAADTSKLHVFEVSLKDPLPVRPSVTPSQSRATSQNARHSARVIATRQIHGAPRGGGGVFSRHTAQSTRKTNNFREFRGNNKISTISAGFFLDKKYIFEILSSRRVD